MSLRELVVLGTSSQVPTRYRNHNAYLLRWDDDGILFDPGEGTQRQMILAEVSVSSVRRICITHFHGDHCLGLAGITQRISLDKVPHEVDVFFPASGQVFYDRLRRASIFRNVATLVPHPVSQMGEILRTKGFSLHTAKLRHGVDTIGYRLVEHDDRTMLPEKLAEVGLQGRAIGQLKREGSIEHEGRRIELDDVSIHKPGQVVAFVMDTRLCDGAFELAANADMLICESTYLNSEAREARDHGHLTAAQAARIARDAGARLLVLTHFSQRYPSTQPFYDEAAAIFPNVVVARDLKRVPVPKRA